MSATSADAQDLPVLCVGDVVHVYPTSPSNLIWFLDAVTGKPVNTCSDAEFEVGRVQAVSRGRCSADDAYQVTVLRGGRVLYVDWLNRWWVRLPHEPSPHSREKN